MNEETRDVRVILGTDGTDGSLGALRFAVAESVRRHAHLEIVHATPSPRPMAAGRLLTGGAGAEVGEKVVADATRAVEQLAPQLVVNGTAISGPKTAALVTLAQGAELLVVGRACRRGLSGFASGHTAGSIAAQAPVPVAVVPPAWLPRDTGDRILVAVKNPAEAVSLLQAAFQRADETGATLEVFHAWKLPDNYAIYLERSSLEESPWHRAVNDAMQVAINPWRTAYPAVPVSVRVVCEQPAYALLDAAEDADLIMLARHPSGHLHRLGGTARAVLSTARCPVLIIPLDTAR